MRYLARLSIYIFVAMLLISMRVSAEETLTDITAEDWFYEDVNYLASKDIIRGYSDGTFRPEAHVNVDAFIKMAVTALGYDLENGKDYWASTYIDKAIELGLIDASLYEVYDRPIIRGEMATISSNALLLNQTIAPYNHYAYEIEDYDLIPGSQQVAVMIAMNEGIVTGYEDYSFRSQNLATRAQAAVVITRLINEEKRQFRDVFQSKINTMEEEKLILVNRTAWMHGYIDNAVDIFAGEDIGINGIEDTDKVLNVLNAYLDEQLSLIESFTIVAFGEASTQELLINGEVWLMERTPDHIQISHEIEENKKLVLDIVDTVYQLRIVDKDKGIQVEYERRKEKNEYYVEFYSEDENLRIGYEISLEPDDKRQVIRELDGDRTVKSYTVYLDDMTVYVDKALKLVFKDVDDNHYEIEKTTDYGTEIFITVHGMEIYSDYDKKELSGMGYRKNEDGVVFIGEFVDGSLDGMGVMFFTNGITLSGEFDHSVPTCRESTFVGENKDINELTDRMNQIIAETTTPDMTRIEKIRAIHDYLVLNITYAKDTIEDELADSNYNNGYTAIMEGEAVCLGYAQAFNLLLNHMGIDAYIVLGDVDKDGRNDHAWNYVNCGIDYKHIDVTWDDRDKGKGISYDYFMKSDDSIRSKRNVDRILGWDE